MLNIKSNDQLQTLIGDLKTLGRKEGVPLWQRIASDLEKPLSARSFVNLSKISFYTQENDVIIIPGKVLGGGELTHPLTVAAFAFSKGAKERIHAKKGKALTIAELMKQNPKAQKLRIFG